MAAQDYTFRVSGCDDQTFIVLNLDDEQADVLRKFSERVTRRSGYNCQPRIRMSVASPGDIEQDTELEAETVERELEENSTT